MHAFNIIACCLIGLAGVLEYIGARSGAVFMLLLAAACGCCVLWLAYKGWLQDEKGGRS